MGRRRTRRIRRKRTRRQRGGSDEPPLEHSSGAKITVIISADKRKPTLDALLRSLQRHGFSYRVVGMGKPWAGFRTKVENYLEGVKSVTSEFVMTLDAFDTLVIQSCDRTLEAYKERPRAHLPVLFGAETYCFPGACEGDIGPWHKKHRGNAGTKDTKKVIIGSGFKKSTVPFFLNSGCILGPRGNIEKLIQEMLGLEFDNDQPAAINVALNNLDIVDLDIEENVFRNRLEHLEKLPDEGTPSGPCVLHFPGQRSEKEQGNLLGLYQKYT